MKTPFGARNPVDFLRNAVSNDMKSLVFAVTGDIEADLAKSNGFLAILKPYQIAHQSSMKL
jgi:hypothetical protein